MYIFFIIEVGLAHIIALPCHTVIRPSNQCTPHRKLPVQSTHVTQRFTRPINARHTANYLSNQRTSHIGSARVQLPTPHNRSPVQSAHITQRITHLLSTRHTTNVINPRHTENHSSNHLPISSHHTADHPSNHITPYNGSPIQSVHAIQRIIRPINVRHTANHSSNQSTP